MIAMFHDDITWCDQNDCPLVNCMRNPVNIMDRSVPHSYAHFRDCDECQIYCMEMAADAERENCDT